MQKNPQLYDFSLRIVLKAQCIVIVVAIFLFYNQHVFLHLDVSTQIYALRHRHFRCSRRHFRCRRRHQCRPHCRRHRHRRHC